MQVAAPSKRGDGPHRHPARLPVPPRRPRDLIEEWVGPGLFAKELRAAAISHTGGEPADDVAFISRTSAGMVATIAAHAGGAPVVSVVPEKGRSDASMTRGCGLAQVEMVEVQADGDWRAVIADRKPRFVVVTTVTSGLDRLRDDVARAVVDPAAVATLITGERA